MKPIFRTSQLISPTILTATRSRTDALSQRTRQGYDALDRLDSTLEDEGGLNLQTRIEYDALDRPTQVADPRQQVTGCNYNGLGEVAAEKSRGRCQFAKWRSM